MKVYYNSGNENIEGKDLLAKMEEESLLFDRGKIYSVKIIEREENSNRGHALDGFVHWESGLHTGLNIGQNPIGTGWKNYIYFLEEMKCEKRKGLYLIDSIIGKPVFSLNNKFGTQGIITPRGMKELNLVDEIYLKKIFNSNL